MVLTVAIKHWDKHMAKGQSTPQPLPEAGLPRRQCRQGGLCLCEGWGSLQCPQYSPAYPQLPSPQERPCWCSTTPH